MWIFVESIFFENADSQKKVLTLNKCNFASFSPIVLKFYTKLADAKQLILCKFQLQSIIIDKVILHGVTCVNGLLRHPL